jgi:hypothetical protein
MTIAARRATQTVDAESHAIRAAVSGLYSRIASEAGALKAQLAARAVSRSDETTANDERGTLKVRLGRYVDPANGEATPVPEGEDASTTPEPSPAPERSLADDELEVLKATLGKSVIPPDARRADDVEALKSKHGGESTTRHGDEEVASLKAKLKNTDRTKADVVGPAPAAVKPAIPGFPRSTAARSGRPPASPTAATQLDAVVPMERRSISPKPERSVERGLAVPPKQPRAAKCRIIWWRGYVSSVFYAIARTAAGDEQVIAESPHFRWRRAEPPPRSPKALEAHRSLLEALERDGWSVAGTGDHWFAHEFERRQAPGLSRAPGSERG